MKTQTERSYRWLLWTLALLGASLDQVSKYGVFKWLYDPQGQGEHEVIPGAFKLLAQFNGKQATEAGVLAHLRTLSGEGMPKVNPGALFGIGGEYAWAANPCFAVVSIIAALAIIYWSTRRSSARDLYLCGALGLILAGTIGNLYDRIVFDGVRDFLYFYWIEWPVFNVADCCLVCGAFLLLCQAFLTRSVPAPRTDSTVSLAAEMAEVN